MDLAQRPLTWEAREPDAYENVYFGIPWLNVPDVGMTIQVVTNDDAVLAQLIADDMAQFAWRQYGHGQSFLCEPPAKLGPLWQTVGHRINAQDLRDLVR